MPLLAHPSSKLEWKTQQKLKLLIPTMIERTRSEHKWNLAEADARIDI